MSYLTDDLCSSDELPSKGIKPEDLPLERPSKLVLNLNTAKQIGVEIPQRIIKAHRVIK